MCRVGRHEEHALAGLARGQCHRRRAGGLANAALAPKEEDAFSDERAKGVGHLAARQRAERRAIHAHAAMPLVELLEQVRVNVEQVQRRRVGQPDDLHVAQEKKEVVQLGGLQSQLALVGAVGRAVKEVADVLAERHRVIIAGNAGRMPETTRLGTDIHTRPPADFLPITRQEVLWQREYPSLSFSSSSRRRARWLDRRTMRFASTDGHAGSTDPWTG